MNAPDVVEVLWNAYHASREQRGTPGVVGDLIRDQVAALRAAAGGADQVVVRWETTTCPECEGEGVRVVPPVGARIRNEGGAVICWHCNRTFTFNFMRDPGPYVCNCERARADREPTEAPCACDGSGRGPEAVTLHRLEATPDPFETFEAGDGMLGIRSRSDLYRLVPVDTSVPAEPAALPEETQP